MKKYLLTTLAALLAVMLVSCGYFGIVTSKAYVCDGEYALCTSAHCIPDPDAMGKATCFCTVQKGKSVSREPCHKRITKIDKIGVTRLISSFSFEDAKSKRAMKCPSGSNWTNCLDKICTVDPMDPKKAICTCQLMNVGEFETFGGSCNKETCKMGFWSGATEKESQMLQKELMKEMNLDRSPQQNCRNRS